MINANKSIEFIKIGDTGSVLKSKQNHNTSTDIQN